MNKPWVTQTLIDCYRANGDNVPGHLLAEQQAHGEEIRRTWSRYEPERQEDIFNPNERK